MAVYAFRSKIGDPYDFAPIHKSIPCGALIMPVKYWRSTLIGFGTRGEKNQITQTPRISLNSATPTISLKFTGNIPYSVLITHMKYRSGILIGFAARSEIVKITTPGDPYDFAQIHRKHPL